jgi:protein involved in polysaccharide export with SLBB domain
MGTSEKKLIRILRCRSVASAIAATLIVIPSMFAADGDKPNPMHREYKLGAGDVLELKFSYAPELDDKVTVRPDGAISLARVGELRAKGSTAAELSQQLTERYAKYLTHPDVTVIVREFAGQKIYVGGEVNVPGLVSIQGSLTCLQAVFNAGGPKPTARLEDVVLMRYDGDNKTDVQKVNLHEVFKGRASDISLQSFDVIFVPRSRISRIDLFVQQYIDGLVPRSLMFPYNINNAFTIHP